MISFGDFRKSKMVRGENPIAKGLGVCLFDYVYIFVDGLEQVLMGLSKAQKRMEVRLLEMEKRGEIFHMNLMLQTYNKFFQENSETADSIGHFLVPNITIAEK